MTKREKTMAFAVACLLPLGLLFLGWTSISTSLEEKNGRIITLTQQLGGLQLDQVKAEMAIERFEEYRGNSLPSKAQKSVTRYQEWLQQLVESSGVQGFTVTVKNRNAPETRMGDGNKTLFSLYRFELSKGLCNIRQLTDLIYKFNQAKLLHRIKDISILPKMEGTGARAEPTGELLLRMTFEVVCMNNAEPERAFENDVYEKPRRPLDEYHNIVSRRNLFGPPNNKPAIGAASRHDFEVGRNIIIDLEGDDEDEGQTLEYEFTNPQWELAEDDPAFNLQSMMSEVDGEVEMGRLPLGTFSFTARVTDNGWPNKTDEKKIQIEVFEEDDDEPIVARPEARDSYVSGKTTRDGSIVQIWIRINPQDKLLMLVEGESFELDKKTWTIDKIEEDGVLIDCDGEKLMFRIGSFLNEPEKVTISAEH